MPSSSADDPYKNYLWVKPETEAHGHLRNTLFSILKDIALAKEARIFDAGCGGGHLLARLFQEGYQDVWGVDISESGIETAQRNHPEIAERFSCHTVYQEKLPPGFPQQGYDLVLSIEVIEHLLQPEKYLRNIDYWLKRGGYLVLSTPYHGYLKNLTLALLGKFDRHFNPLNEHGHVKFFSKRTLSIILAQTGFKILKIYGSGRVPCLWKSMLASARKR